MNKLTSLITLLLSIACVNALAIPNILGFPVPGTSPVPGDSPLLKCDIKEDQILTLTKLTIDPNPPQRGENMTISAVGELSKAIEEGAYVDVVVTYGYIKLIQQTYDLCEQLPNVEMTCPVNKGDYNLVKQVEIPKQVPPGKYTVTARAYTADDELITCLTGTVEFPAAALEMALDSIVQMI